MKRYESYKDSGVKWLGEIPSHWEIMPGLAILKENKTKNTDLLEKTVLSLSYGKIVIKKDIDEGLVPADYKGYQIVHPGYIIIRCTDLQNDKVSLRTGLVKDEGIITGAYLGLIVDENYNSSYIHYFLHSWDITKEIYRHGSGLRQSLSWLDLRRLPILLPTREEQNEIVSYLDSATSKIDEAIAQQQKMIDLLNERKQIIINNAVTKGLDPNVPMKDSCIDWIGDIPEHWSLMKLKYLGMMKSGDGIKNEQLKENGEYPVWGGNGLMGYTDTYNTKDNAIVIGRVGALCGNVRLVYSPVFVTDNALIYSITGIIDHKFLLYAMRSANLNSLNSSNAQPLITGTKVKNVSIPYPSKDIQKKIVSYIDNRIYQIDKVIENYSSSISLLQERKQIIINDVVTGKVKVV